MASEIDLEKAQEARREAEQALESRLRRGRRPRRRPGAAPGGAAPDPASPSAVTARVRAHSAAAGARRSRRTDMADARPFHWEFTPEPVDPRGLPDRGRRAAARRRSRSAASKNAALKMLAAATLTGERCRFTNVPEIEDVRVMAETLRDLGVVVDHPAPNVYEVASGDVEWLFVPLEAAAKMRASFMLLGPLLARFGRVIISNPGGDRIGRRPVDLHVEAMRTLGADDRLPQRLLLRDGAGPAARDGDPLPVRVGHGHRERDARRDPRRRPHGHPAGRPGARGRRPDRVPPEDGRRRRADLPGHDRGPAASGACAAPSTTSSRTGSRPARSSSPARVTGGQRHA